jgi:hypothetical protein
MLTSLEVSPPELKCGWRGCNQSFSIRVYYFEDKRFCSVHCMEHGARDEISKALFQAPKRYVINGKMR